MKHLPLFNSIINNCPNLLLGGILAIAASLAMTDRAIALPTLTVTKTTSTPSLIVGDPATYTIVVENTGSSAVSSIKIVDTLPPGFTYENQLSIVMNSGVTRTTGYTDPTFGSTTPTWTNFMMVNGGKIKITFIADTYTGLVGTYNNSVTVSESNSPVLPGYVGTSSTAEDVTLTQPILIPPTPGTSPAPTLSTAQVCGNPGNDGIGGTQEIVNRYYPPTSTTAPAGTNSITLGQSLGSGYQIYSGDLVMVIQMQDASINSDDSSIYGSGSSTNLGSGQVAMNSTGLYEYAIATSNVPTTGGTLTLLGKGTNNGLINSYTNTAAGIDGKKTFQVIRVPQYSSVTLSTTLKALKWNGQVGGIFAVDIVGQLNFNSRTIDLTSTGFRGGYTDKHTSTSSTNAYRSSMTTFIGSGKGEGTAGTPKKVWDGTSAVTNSSEGYPNGDTGRGAPANAGGGGNMHNAGGGGGGNGGIGGQGGLPWEGQNGAVDAGGRPGFQSSLYTPVPWRLIMGGGGGGGDANDAQSGVRGGVGAGIAIIRAGLLTGNGNIVANGDDGDAGVAGSNPDGAGGGGAGGTVLIQSRQSSSGVIAVNTQGGKGGNTENDDQTNKNKTPHGPGGGAGGGVVLYSGVVVNANIAPGIAGMSNKGIAPTTNHGATDGTVGNIGTFDTSTDPFFGVNGANCLPNLTVTKVTNTPKVNRLGIAKYKITVANTATIGKAVDVNIEDPLPAGFTYTATDSIGLVGVVSTNPTTGVSTTTNVPTVSTAVNPTVGNIKPVWGKFTIPAGGKVVIDFQAKVGATVTSGTYNNQAESKYLDPARLAADAVLTNSYYDYLTNIGEDVTVNSNAQVLMVKRITAINGLATNPNNSTIKLDQFVPNTTTVAGVPINDKSCYWPTSVLIAGTQNCTNTYTLGAIDAGIVKPSDTIEYTVYFLNAGGANATNVRICDLLRPGQTYVPGSLSLKVGGNPSQPLTDLNDTSTSIDRGQFVAATNPISNNKPTNCNLSALSTTNPNGVVAIDLTGTTGTPSLTEFPTSTTPVIAGAQPAYYGWLRFRTTVN